MNDGIFLHCVMRQEILLVGIWYLHLNMRVLIWLFSIRYFKKLNPKKSRKLFFQNLQVDIAGDYGVYGNGYEMSNWILKMQQWEILFHSLTASYNM